MDIPIGFCVRTESVMCNGKLCFVAKMKRDSTTTWKTTVVGLSGIDGDKLAVDAWIQKFTGEKSDGFNADCRIIARGNDANGCYWILQPVHFY